MRKFALTVTYLSVLSALVFGGVSNAAMLSFMDEVALQPTNWNETLSISKFNPNWGTLNSIKYTLDGRVEGSAKYENLDAAAATITLDLEAQITLQKPDGSLLVQVFPLVQVNDNAGAFDGTIDFGGTSGATFDNLMGEESDSLTSTNILDLILFTGEGSIDLPIVAVGLSSGTGAGNLITQFKTDALAKVTVEYDYTPVPIPAGLWLLGTGLIGLWGLKRKKRV